VTHASALFGLWLALQPAATTTPAAAARLTLRSGITYLLKESPRISGTRVIFTTQDGRMFSMDESEIESIGEPPKPTVTPRRYNTQDSHALGAIARQQREARGKRAEVAPRAARPPRKTPKPGRPRRTPTPRPSS
jgi:hypothetical protein